jgi:hypothetical protein
MANRDKKPNATNGTVEYRRPIVEFEHRGIYIYANLVGHETITLTEDQFNSISKPADIAHELAAAITAARSVAAEKIKSFLTPVDRSEKSLDEVPQAEASFCLVWQETAYYERLSDGTAIHKGGYYDTTALQVGDQFVSIIDLGDGPRWYKLDGKPPDDVAVALAALRAIEHMKAGGTDATFHAFRLGRLLERLNAMQYEPDALKGKQQAQRARHAGKTRELLTEDQQLAAATEIRNLMASGTPEQTACKGLVKKYGCDFKILKRYYRKHRGTIV